MNDNRHARRKKRSILRQLTCVGLIMGLVLVTTLLVVPRFIVVSTDATSPASTTPDSRTQPAGTGVGRGIIYDRNGHEMAVNNNTSMISAHPLEMKNVTTAAGQLAAILDLKPDDLAASLKAERSIVRLGRNIARGKAQQVAGLHLQGVYVTEEAGRFYPQHQVAAHVLGYAENGHGLNGVEFRYNDLLQKGFNSGLDDDAPPTAGEAGAGQGAHLALTIDLRIQTMLEDQLQALVKKTDAEAGSALLIDPRNGAVLALANLPSFDPNLFSEFSDNNHLNRARESPVTLGTIGDLFLLGASLEREAENRLAVPTTVEDADAMLIAPLPYKRPIAVQEIHLDDTGLRDYARRLGFSDAALSATAASTIHDQDDAAEIASPPVPFRLDSPFRATPLELATALCGLINGGRRITPQLLARAYDPSTGQEKPFLADDTGSTSTAELALQQDISHDFLEIINKVGRSGPNESLFMESTNPETPMPSTPATSVIQLADVIKQTHKDTDRTQALLVGLTPASDPNLVMVVTLNQADTKTFKRFRQQTSPLLAMGRRSISLAKQWANETTATPTAELWKKTEETPLKHWKIKPHPAAGSAMANELQTVEMPDVVGKSLRGGLQVLQSYDLRIRVVGSGRIINQHPLPKTAMQNGAECILELNPDH